jgi:hypothetical protein
MRSFIVYLADGKEVKIEADKVEFKGLYVTFHSKERIAGIFSFANICGFICQNTGDKGALFVGSPS